MTEAEIRQAVKDAGVKLLESNLVQGTWGNISIRIDDKKMVVTPSGMDYIRMRPEDTVVVDIETLEYTSDVKPTSEKKIHAAIYRDKDTCGYIPRQTGNRGGDTFAPVVELRRGGGAHRDARQGRKAP